MMNESTIPEREFIDALARIGPQPGKHVALPWRLDQLPLELERC